jgi:hypothetical protein
MGNSAGSHAKFSTVLWAIHPINRQRKTQKAAAETESFRITLSENDSSVRDGSNYDLSDHGSFSSKNKVFVLVRNQNMRG